MISQHRNSAGFYRWLIFWILALGYILVYFHRLCPAVMAVDMMADLKTGGALTGFLASAYFYPYAMMQLPAGLLSDSWGPRNTITAFFLLLAWGPSFWDWPPLPGWRSLAAHWSGLGWPCCLFQR